MHAMDSRSWFLILDSSTHSKEVFSGLATWPASLGLLENMKMTVVENIPSCRPAPTPVHTPVEKRSSQGCQTFAKHSLGCQAL